MLHKEHVLTQIIRPTLSLVDMWVFDVDILLLGTALAESNLKYLCQLGSGPAIGLWQMEPETHDDIWKNWLNYRPEQKQSVMTFLAPQPSRISQLGCNLSYACIMARIKYMRDPDSIPHTALGMAQYWKKVYNTEFGAGKVEDKLWAFEEAVRVGNGLLS